MVSKPLVSNLLRHSLDILYGVHRAFSSVSVEKIVSSLGHIEGFPYPSGSPKSPKVTFFTTDDVSVS